MGFARIVMMAWLLAVLSGCAGTGLVEDRDYVRIDPPQAVASGQRIEVIEFFWYGCPHCYALEPLIDPWMKKLQKDTVFKRVPEEELLAFRSGNKVDRRQALRAQEAGIDIKVRLHLHAQL